MLCPSHVGATRSNMSGLTCCDRPTTGIKVGRTDHATQTATADTFTELNGSDVGVGGVDMLINIISRDMWHAATPRAETPTAYQVSHVFWMNVKKNPCFTRVHCRETLKRAQRYNMTVQNQRDIRYNFMVGGDGNIYEGRGWGFTPLLPKEFARVNTESIIIGFMGSFNTAEELPDDMFKLGQELTEFGVACDYIAKDFVFHDFLIREFPLRTYEAPAPGRAQPSALENPYRKASIIHNDIQDDPRFTVRDTMEEDF